MKSFYKSKKEADYNFLDRFLIKLVFGLTVVLLVVVLNRFKVISLDSLQKTLSEQINIAKVVETVTGESNLINFKIDKTAEVDATTFSSITNNNNIYTLGLGNYQAVETVKCGVVVKINKNQDETYLVVIKGYDGYEYHYNKLTSIDVNIYQLLNANEIIGKASQTNDKNFYQLVVYDNGEEIAYFS